MEFSMQEYWSGIEPGFLHCRQILDHLNHQGSLFYTEVCEPLHRTFICIWLTVISIICAAVFGYELLPAFPSLNRNQGSYESGKGKLTFIEHLLCAKLFHDYSKYEVGISHEE